MIEHAIDLLKLFKLEEVPAEEVENGDVIWGSGYVALVRDIQTLDHPDGMIFVFNNEPAPGSGGYERSINRREGKMIKRVPRRYLRPGIGREAHEQETTIGEVASQAP